MAKRSPKRRGNGEGSVFELPDGSWRGYVTVGFDNRGRQVKRWRRGKTQREVVARLNEIAHLAGSRRVLNPEKVTVGEWLGRFVDLRARSVRPRTLENYAHYLGKIGPAIGSVPLAKLTPMQIRGLYVGLQDEGLSASVRKHVHHFLRSACRDAVRMELIERNPVDSLDAPSGGSVVKPQVWTAAELRAYLATARNERWYAALYLMATLGLRVGEALGLAWADLSGDRLVIRRTLAVVANRPSFGPPKTERGRRTIFLSGDVVEVLEERRGLQAVERAIAKSWIESDLVFTTGVGTPVNHNNLRRLHRRIVSIAGVPHIRVHDLRHTYITMARDAGVDAEVLANRVGQDVRVTMRIYSQVTEARQRKAALSLAELAHG